MRLATLALLASFAARAGAQEPPEETALPLSLDGALERARAASLRLAQFQSLRDAASESVRGARAQRLPQLDLGASYTRVGNLPELMLGGGGPDAEPFLPPNLGVFFARAALRQPVYTGGRTGATIDAAAAQAEAAEAERGDAASSLTLETSSAYWGLLSARERERVVNEALAAFEAHLSDARNRQKFGMAAANEVLAVQVERDRADLQRLQAANAAAQANANLLRLCGLPANTRIEPSDTPASNAPPPPLQPELLIPLALDGRKDAAGLRARVAAAEAGVRIQKATARPRVGLSAGYVFLRADGTTQPLFPDWKGAWTAGVDVSWSPFDFGRSGAAAAEAEARARAARQQLEDLERRIRLDVTARVLDLRTAQAAHGVAQRALQAARENQRVSNDRYRQGVSTSSDLLDAEAALLRAGLDETDAAILVRLYAAQLERALGR